VFLQGAGNMLLSCIKTVIGWSVDVTGVWVSYYICSHFFRAGRLGGLECHVWVLHLLKLMHSGGVHGQK